MPGSSEPVPSSAPRQFKDVEITDDEEQQLGDGGQRADPQAVRRRAGSGHPQVRHAASADVLAQASTRPNLAWKFIVLDTDGVNAFAAPGGYVHITRGALR